MLQLYDRLRSFNLLIETCWNSHNVQSLQMTLKHLFQKNVFILPFFFRFFHIYKKLESIRHISIHSERFDFEQIHRTHPWSILLLGK